MVLFLLFINLLSGCLPEEQTADPIITDGQLIAHTLPNDIRIEVYLPPNYDDTQNYKTIYFNDGGAIFYGSGSLHLGELLDKNIISGKLDGVVAIGIYSTDRTSWYTPYYDEWAVNAWGPYNPTTDWYNTQLKEVIIPFVEAEYSVMKNAENRAIFGFSLGGLHAGHTLLTTNLFGFSAAISPSFWVKDYSIFDDPKISIEGKRLWMDIGTKEWNYYVPFHYQLHKDGLQAGVDNFYYEVPDADHNASSWSQRVIHPLTLFLGSQKMSPMTWKIVKEKIPSKTTPGQIFRRINPIVTLENGVVHSLCFLATYKITKGSGKVNIDGSYEIEKGNSMKVEVSYLNWKEEITVN